MGYSEYLATLIASVSVSIILAVFFWNRRQAPGALTLASLSLMILVWTVGYIVEITANSLSGFRLANSIEYIGIANIPVLWFIFTLQYTRYYKWLKRNWYLLFIVPIITIILVWTNLLHGWMWDNARLENFGEFIVQIKTYGPGFWIHSTYSYVLSLLGIAIISISLINSRTLYRNQNIILLIAIIFPLIWNVIYVLKAPPTYRVDMTPSAFVLSGLIVALGLFRFNFLKIVPIARNMIFENMDDSVIILDRQNHILDINPAAEKLFGNNTARFIGEPADMLWSKQPGLQRYIQSEGKLQTEINIQSENKQRSFELCLIPLRDLHKNITGRVLTLHDLTERKKMEQSLKDYAKRITQVQEEERKRIAYELHDDTAQYLSILKLQIDALLKSGKIQDQSVLKKLEYLEKDADRAFQDVRRYSHELRPGVLEHLGLHSAIEQIAEDYNKLEQLSVEVEVEGSEPKLAEDVKLGLFRIAQEALNNTRKHANATKSVISLVYQGNLVRMIVSDDGNGFDIQEAMPRAGKKGSLGLMSMQERANLIGANLKIESEIGKGTIISVDVLI